MSKPVKLTELVVAAIESEMRPRETYSQTIERLLKELGRYRARVRILDADADGDLAAAGGKTDGR